MIPQGSYLEVENDFKFHFYDEGDGDVVVLLHGSGTGASGYTNFKNNFVALKQAGFRVILPDLPGYGFSSKPENEIYSLDYFNTKIIQLLDALEIKSFSLIGNSLGGALSIGLALSNPKRINKLILMAPGGIEDREVYNEMPGIKIRFSGWQHGSGKNRRIAGAFSI